jgi:hypothetical protein
MDGHDETNNLVSEDILEIFPKNIKSSHLFVVNFWILLSK